MTAKEAAEVLASLKINGLRSGKTRLAEAMNMAIKALSQDGDAISRWVAIGNITIPNIERNMDSVMDGDIHRTARAVERILAALPSVSTDIHRCETCEHRKSSLYCDAWNNSPGFPCVPDDGYCWLYERRTDG